MSRALEWGRPLPDRQQTQQSLIVTDAQGGLGENCVFERSEMLITIFATRFEGGVWKDWEHACTFAETEAVIDSAKAKGFEHGRIGEPVFIDYLEGARYVFDVAFGTKNRPRDGDTKVYGVLVGGMVIAEYQGLQRHIALKLTA